MRLGLADDVSPGDGVAILDHEQAKAAARSWAKTMKAGHYAPAVALTVKEVLDRSSTRGMKLVEESRGRAAFSIRPKLGTFRVTELSIAKIRSWRDGLVTAEKKLRTARYADKPNFVVVDLKDPDAIRRPRDTANRTLTTLKAALNFGAHLGRAMAVGCRHLRA